jgi:hypothetical protein
MSTSNAEDDALLEECIDELDAAVQKLERFPSMVIAHALRAHLAGLLSAMAEAGLQESSQLAEFLAGLEAEVLESE